MMILLLSLVINLKPFFVFILFLFIWFMSIIIIFIFYFVWLVGYYTLTALPLLVVSMFFTHVVMLLRICYVISDKQKYIYLVVAVVPLAVLATAASFYWSFSHFPFTSLWLAIGTLYSVCLFYNLAIFYDSCCYLCSLLFIIPKTKFVSSFACVLCSPFPSADRVLLDCVINRKVRDIIFEAILTPSERYQNIQDNLEYNSVLPFRIILKIFAVNKLKFSLNSLFTGKHFWNWI